MSDADRPAMTREELDRLLAPSGQPARRPAATSPAAGSPGTTGRGVTSDLSIDETLLLHAAGWEPVDMVIGAAVAAIPTMGFARSGWAGATDQATQAFTVAVSSAVARIRDDCARAGGAGVVGVDVDFEVHRHTVHAVLVGTAVAPPAGGGGSGPFVSDLSVRDFLLLRNAGWAPRGLAFGASFVQVPYRSIGTVLKQVGANAEMTNLTEAMYAAREKGMEHLQSSALGMGASGVVAVRYEDRPLPFASHVIGFTAWGTAIRLAGDAHRRVTPRMVVPLDDAADRFDLQGALRGSR